MSNKLDKTTECGILVFILFLPILNAIAYIGLLVALICWLCRVRVKKIFISPSLRLALLCFALAVLLSAVFSHNKLQSWGGYLLFIFYILTFVLMTQEHKIREKILWMVMFSILLVSIFGIVQYFTKLKFHIKTPLFSYSVYTDVCGIGATFDNPNRFAEYLVPVILLTFSLFISKLSLRKRILSGVSLALELICLFLSKSLAGTIVVILLLPIILILKNWKIGLCLLFFMLISGWLMKSTFTKFSSKNNINARIYSWEEIVPKVFKSFPLTGYGLATYKDINDKYGEGEKTLHSSLHNLYLNFLCELGILGIGTFLWVVVLFLKASIPKLRLSSEICACTFAVISVLLHGMSETVLNYFQLGLFFWTLMGLALAKAPD